MLSSYLILQTIVEYGLINKMDNSGLRNLQDIMELQVIVLKRRNKRAYQTPFINNGPIRKYLRTMIFDWDKSYQAKLNISILLYGPLITINWTKYKNNQ